MCRRGFNVHLLTRDTEHLFMCLWSICISALEKCLFKNFACFLMNLFVFISLCGTSPLHTLSTEAAAHASHSPWAVGLLCGRVTGRTVKPNCRCCFGCLCCQMSGTAAHPEIPESHTLWYPNFRFSCGERVPALSALLGIHQSYLPF